MRVLECSSRGDKRFSAYYAKVHSFNGYDSIEHHYQSCKRDANGNQVAKGKYVHHIELNGKSLPAKYLTAYYTLLWIKYLDNHPELVEYAKAYDDFSDMFKGRNTKNCQADVIRMYVKHGRESLLTKELVDLLTKL